MKISCLIIMLSSFFLISCAGQYYSTQHKEGETLLFAKQYDKAIQALQEAVAVSERRGNAQEITHIKSLLSWAYAEAMKFDDAEREEKEAIKIAESHGFQNPLFYAQLAIIASKSGNYKEGMAAAEKGLNLTAEKWKDRTGTHERDAIIDYAVKHHGYPPDVDMLKTITMSESALSVLYFLNGDNQKSVEWGEQAIHHMDEFSFLINLASSGEKRNFYQGRAVAAAVTSRAYKNLGNGERERYFLAIGKEAFKKIVVDVKGDDLLSAYAESGAYPSFTKMTSGAFKPDPKYSEDFNRAEKYYFDGDYSNAIRVYREVIDKAKAARNIHEAGKGMSQLGGLLAEMGRYPEAIRLLRESISVAPHEDFTVIAYVLISAIEARLGHYEKGLEDADEGLNLLLERRKKMFEGKDRDSVIAAAIKNPGLPPDVILIKAVISAEAGKTTIYHLKGDYEKAISQGEKTIEHFHDVLNAIILAPEREQVSYFEGLGFVSLAVGDSYLNIGEIKKGREYLKKAREYFKKARLNFGDVAAEGLIGYSYVMEGDYKRGADILKINMQRIETGGFEEIKWHIRSKFAKNLYHEAELLGAKLPLLAGIAERAQGEDIKREMMAQNWGKIDMFGSLLGKESEKRFSEIITGLENANDREAMLTQANALVRLLKEEAYKNYLGAIENIESIRSILETDLNKRLFQANKQAIYTDFIQLSVDLYGAEKGFEAVERAKARGLMDLLATKEIAFKQREVLHEEKAVGQSYAEAALATKQAEQGLKHYGGGIPPSNESLLERYRGILLKVKREEPELASFVTAGYLTFKEFKKELPRDVSLVEYYLTDSKLYIWTLNRENIDVVQVPIQKAHLKSSIHDLRNALIAKDGEKAKLIGKGLYDVLIAPAKGAIKGQHLGILPHDVLHYLPFNLLFSGKRYLIEQHPLFFAPSVSILHYAMRKSRPKGFRTIAFGNPDLGNPAYDLPFAQKEVEGLTDIYPSVKTYVRTKASEGIAKSEIGSYDIIHFASHAEFSAIDPLYSSIRLAADSEEDGRLEVSEVFSLDIKAYLITLSACNTGVGVVTTGDEVIGMNRAFIYAGAPSIVASLWSVSDTSTARLMKSFYQNLKTMPKDEALQKAQIELLESGDLSSPFFWAPFYLTGDWQ